LFGPLLSLVGGKKLSVPGAASNHQGDLSSIQDLVASGKLRTPIDRRYAASDVSSALRYLGEGQARGKLVITV